MPPGKTPKRKTGFFGMREKPSGNYVAEFTNAARSFWLGTYPTVHEAACAYDVAVWRAGRPRKDLSFPEIETKAAAEMLVPEGIHMEEITAKKKIKKKRPVVVIACGESDEVAMMRFAREHPKYVQTEQEFY
ncbi:hypothetical protein ZWY2020_007993 [Hordeum vulgare]|nr:hypothetical protein ZWY2020_007993 [Hordeum vulgare]